MRSSLALLVGALTLVVAAACARAAPTPTPTPTVRAATTPAAVPSPTLPAVETPVGAPAAAAFFLKVSSPQNESVVVTPRLSVAGETTPDAVVTINGQLIEVDADGRFEISLALEEGPNVIEVVASDFDGHNAQEVRSVLLVP